MLNVSIMRGKCYLIVQGLERSLLDNLHQNFDVSDEGFLRPDEKDNALERLQKDLGEEWGVESIDNRDLLDYVDLGTLMQLINRHKENMRNAKHSDVQSATQIIDTSGILKIRNRVMHPVRSLEPNDFQNLYDTAQKLLHDAPSLAWHPLREGIAAADGNDPVTIPAYRLDDSRIPNNLPSAEFADTGFIGRRKEREDLKKRIKSHNVITVVGAGGEGKTALALRVCQDILDDSTFELDKIVWVSLKMQRLTADGIREINDAVNTTDRLVSYLNSEISVPSISGASRGWDKVLEYVEKNKTLLVIDNLETLGQEILDLAVGIPSQSKLLLTSRIGLGQIELRYDMPPLSLKDAVDLMRNLGVVHSAIIKTAPEQKLKGYCEKLHRNPLLIKWFVQAVGKGITPKAVLSHSDFNSALRFCWENVYDQLSSNSRRIISILLAAKRDLSGAQIQEIMGINNLTLVQAIRELQQSNIVEWNNNKETYQIGSLVLDYLSRNHPPDNKIFRQTNDKFTEWRAQVVQREIDNTHRYAWRKIRVETPDQRIAAPYLRRALSAISERNIDAAKSELDKAEDLTPDWWEVHRIKAEFLKHNQSPIYDVERAFEDSIAYSDTDVSRYLYANYLISIDANERALEHMHEALQHAPQDSPDEIFLRSIKAECLKRLNNLPDALQEFEYVWTYRYDDSPDHLLRKYGTQYAGVLSRYVEQLIASGQNEEAQTHALKGILLTNETSKNYEWDQRLAEVGIRLLSELIKIGLPQEVGGIIRRWDSDDNFVVACRSRIPRSEFLANSELRAIMPKSSNAVLGEENTQQHEGVIDTIRQQFGFIKSTTAGRVHMTRASLARPSEWESLRVGQLVTFRVENNPKGPHAVWLESE